MNGGSMFLGVFTLIFFVEEFARACEGYRAKHKKKITRR